MLSINFSILFISILAGVVGFIIFKPSHRWIVLLFISLLFYSLTLGYQVIIALVFAAVVYIGSHHINKISLNHNLAKTVTAWYVLLCLIPLLGSKLSSIIPINTNWNDSSIVIEYSYFNSLTPTFLCFSYFTFNGIGYLIDIRKRYVKPEPNFLRILLYIIFFPILLSGPLLRSSQLLGQFKGELFLSYRNFSYGFRLFLWGVFKNFVLGQQFYIYMKTIEKSDASGFLILLQGLSFFFYLYFTFSSYVDIFTGISRIFNIQLVRNFGNRVYASTSRKKFWSEWHITLNNWFRDYFFFAIAKKVRSKLGLNIAMLITFLLIGLWHGISFQFAIWGLLNGLWVITEERLLPYFNFISPRVKNVLGLFYHLIFASFLAIIFSSKLPLLTYSKLFSPTTCNSVTLYWLFKHGLIIFLLFAPFDWISRKMGAHNFDVYLDTLSFSKRWFIYIFLAIGISAFTTFWSINNYYFKF